MALEQVLLLPVIGNKFFYLTLSTSKKLVLNLIKSKDSFYSFSSKSYKLKKENTSVLSKKNWDKINLIDTNNDFLLLPSKLPNFLKNIDIDKTIGINSKSIKKVEKVNNIGLSFFYSENSLTKKANNINHIGKIILNELLKNKLKSKELYVLTIHNKIFICLVKNNKLLFYNQFEFKGSNYIKYIILLFDEYKLDRNKTSINLLNESLNEEELKKFFSNIYLYKKSIFEIIDEYYG